MGEREERGFAMILRRALWRIQDVWLARWLPYELRRYGVEVEGPVRFRRRPIVTAARDSRIRIGGGTVLCCRSFQPALYVDHAVVLGRLLTKLGVD